MDFVNFAREHGVEIGRIKTFEKICRCPTTTHPKSDNGAYWTDGRRGWVQAWDGDGEIKWYDDPHAKPWTDADKREWLARRDAERRQQESRYKQAAQAAEKMLREAELTEHGYLKFKGFKEDRGMVADGEVLLVPMRDCLTNALTGAQRIWWEADSRQWIKKMIPGMRAKGAVLRIGRGRVAVMCEGYVTGLSIKAAIDLIHMDACVLVCFSDSNMVHVATLTMGPRVVFADHDESGAGLRAAIATGLPHCMSSEVKEDANDLHQRAGLLAVGRLLMEVINQ